MASKTKTSTAIDAVTSAQTLQELQVLIDNLIPSLPQQKMRDRVTVAATARRCQLDGSPSYKIGFDNVIYLRLVLETAIPGLDVAFVQDLNTNILKGRYMIASDSYRFHCVAAPHLPVGSYHLYDDTAYQLVGEYERQVPMFSSTIEILHPSFLSKAKWAANTKLDEHFFYHKGSDIPYVILSATDDKQLKFGGSYHSHALPQILNAHYIYDAVDGRDCVFLLGYSTWEPVVIVDSDRRVAFIAPINNKEYGERRLPFDYHRGDDQRRFAMLEVICACYESMVTYSPEGTRLDGKTFNMAQPAEYFAYQMLQFNPADISKFYHVCYHDPVDIFRGHIYTELRRLGQ